MTFEGARHQTADEMRMVLYLPSDEVNWRDDLSGFIHSINSVHDAYKLTTANALWAQKKYPFNDDYLKLIKSTYFSEARNLDFVADPDAQRVTINNWVSNHTNDRIKNLLPPRSIDRDTRLVITNAVYFKGTWETPFEKLYTKPSAFWIVPDQSIQTPTMGLFENSFNYAENDQAQLIQLPYKGNDLSMIIVLPRSKDIKSLEKVLTLDTLKQWQGSMATEKINVYIPKFKFDWNMQMGDILRDMGMKSAFDPGNADFSGMSAKMPDGNLYISAVIHKAWIETNEEGTEAAAATAIIMAAGSAAPITPPKEFRADHPFIFFIQDNKTGYILFMGRVSDPREK
jgi:serpin B